MSEPDESLLDKALMEVADARQLDETPLPPSQPDWTMMLYRLDQAEWQIRHHHPKAARDGRLASILSALRDEITPFTDGGGKGPDENQFGNSS